MLNVDEIDFFVSDSVLSWKSIACEDSSGSAFHKKKKQLQKKDNCLSDENGVIEYHKRLIRKEQTFNRIEKKNITVKRM